jgi:hypothetical protein
MADSLRRVVEEHRPERADKARTDDSSAGKPVAEAKRAVEAAGVLAQLARVMEAEVVPRLVLAHRAAPRPVAAAQARGGPSPHADEVEEIVRLVLTLRGAEAASSYVETLRSRGVPSRRSTSTCWHPPPGGWASSGPTTPATSRT